MTKSITPLKNDSILCQQCKKEFIPLEIYEDFCSVSCRNAFQSNIREILCFHESGLRVRVRAIPTFRRYRDLRGPGLLKDQTEFITTNGEKCSPSEIGFKVCADLRLINVVANDQSEFQAFMESL